MNKACEKIFQEKRSKNNFYNMLQRYNQISKKFNIFLYFCLLFFIFIQFL